MAIEVKPDDRARARESLQQYFLEEWDTEVGDLKADLLLDFLLEEIGPVVYNAAIADAQAYLRDRVADLEGALYAPEFPHWPRNR